MQTQPHEGRRASGASSAFGGFYSLRLYFENIINSALAMRGGDLNDFLGFSLAIVRTVSGF
ncbi:MAG: hypothetical protein MUE85_10990 [Microscillaceae bacterium]|nr:hypothetical protein [Microscillaceae bacterium]